MSRRPSTKKSRAPRQASTMDSRSPSRTSSGRGLHERLSKSTPVSPVHSAQSSLNRRAYRSTRPSSATTTPPGSPAGSGSSGGGVLSPPLSSYRRNNRRPNSPGARSSTSTNSSGSTDSRAAPRAGAMLQKLAEFKDDDRHVDLILNFPQGEIRCHRIVLAASSQYFCDMLAHTGPTARQEIIKMSGVDMHVVGALVDYAYTSVITVGRDRIKTLLEAATLFGFQSIRDACIAEIDRRSRRKTRPRSTSRQRDINGIEGGPLNGSGVHSNRLRERSHSSTPPPRFTNTPPPMSPPLTPPVTPPVSPPKAAITTGTADRDSSSDLDPRDTSFGSTGRVSISDADHSALEDSVPEGSDTKGLSPSVVGIPSPVSTNRPRLPDADGAAGGDSSGSDSFRSSPGTSVCSIEIKTRFVFHDTKHASRAMRQCNFLRKEGRLIDAVLHTRTKCFPCHRVIIEAASEYLAGLFAAEEVDQEKVMDIHIKKISAEVMQKLMTFMYLGKVLVAEREAEKVMRAAQRFGLAGLADGCRSLLPTEHGNTSRASSTAHSTGLSSTEGLDNVASSPPV
ncbi:uncharacterized protein [Amphiura filiformis]|uniref:uncharacterized protein n=1 Tax=Amphiura filiformis TaxID=82378 RepID=UPI003B21C046